MPMHTRAVLLTSTLTTAVPAAPFHAVVVVGQSQNDLWLVVHTAVWWLRVLCAVFEKYCFVVVTCAVCSV